MLTTNDTQTTIDKISFYQNEFENLVQNRPKDEFVRARVRWAENVKKNPKYYLNLEKRNYNKNVIHKLKCGKDFIKADQKAILAELVYNYKQLYSIINCTKSQTNDRGK